MLEVGRLLAARNRLRQERVCQFFAPGLARSTAI